MASGGGGLGIVGLIVGLVLAFSGGGGSAIDVLNQLNGLNGQQVGQPGAADQMASECRTGADAQRTEDCRIVGYVNSIRAYWAKTVRGYTVVPTVFSAARPRPDAARRRPRWARSIARPTRMSTSSWGSSTNSGRSDRRLDARAGHRDHRRSGQDARPARKARASPSLTPLSWRAPMSSARVTGLKLVRCHQQPNKTETDHER
jgi:hypothetical protein